jgi:flagellar secretion chaperone FliS
MTNNRNAAQFYQQDNAQGASAIGGVVALYDTILRDLQRATASLAAGNIEARVLQLNHALLVIGELHGVLDYERGGEAARRFSRFFEVTRGMILEANLRCTAESLQQLIDLFSPVRQAWRTVDQKLPATEIRQAARSAPPAAFNAPETDTVKSSGTWAA